MNIGLGHCPLGLALTCYASLETLLPPSALVPTPAQLGWQ